MTGATFPVVTEGDEAATRPVISIGHTKKLAAADLPQKEADLELEGIAIGVEGRNLYLWGGSMRGPINTVFVLLEEDLGCRWYSYENKPVIAHRPTLTFRPVPRVYIPPLEMRDPFYSAALQPEWSLQNRTNSRNLEMPDEVGGYPKSVPGMVHTSEHYVSSKEYFETHPEYFSLNKDGQRKPRQLCLTNPDVQRISVEKALSFLADEPDARFLDFSANDWADNCLCENCKAIDQAEATDHGYGSSAYGSHAGTTVTMVNVLVDAIADKYPDVRVTALAYLGTLEPPKHLRPHKNVRIVMSTSAYWGTVNRYVTESAEQADIMRGWNKVGAKLIIWHYPIVFGPNFAGPTLNLRVISGDMRFFINNGAKGIMLQALDTYTRGVDRELLRCWLSAKQMWNPQLNTAQLVRDFTYGFYGPAAEPMQNFQQLLDETWDDNHLEPAFQYGSLTEKVFEPYFINTAMAYLEEAENLAGDNLDLRMRVRLARTPIQYVKARRGPVDGLAAFNELLDQMLHFATQEYGMPVLEWPSSSSFAGDILHWRKIAAFDARDSAFYCLGPQWEFLHDPQQKGTTGKWFTAGGAPPNWQTLHDDQVKGFNPQGLNELKGDVWFRAPCQVPENFDSRKHYWLLLDAFDREDIWVYLDGELVFKQVTAEEGRPIHSGWMQYPVMVAARNLFTPGREHDLVLRFHYRARATHRRFMPVSLISSDLPPLTAGGFPDAHPGREIARIWPTAVEEHRRIRNGQ